MDNPRFWTLNIGHVLTIATMLLGGLVGYTTFVREFDGLQARVIVVEHNDATTNTLPGRVTVLETRFELFTVQLAALNLGLMRMGDSLVAVREDTAAIKAGLAVSR